MENTDGQETIFLDELFFSNVEIEESPRCIEKKYSDLRVEAWAALRGRDSLQEGFQVLRGVT